MTGMLTWRCLPEQTRNIDARIPHLSSLMVDEAGSIINECDVIVINYKDPEFTELVINENDKTLVDFVRLDEELLHKPNYIGLNW